MPLFNNYDEAIRHINDLDEVYFENDRIEYIGIRQLENFTHEVVRFEIKRNDRRFDHTVGRIDDTTRNTVTVPLNQLIVDANFPDISLNYFRMNDLPVDFRVSLENRTGCAHIFIDPGVDNDDTLYFLTSAHVFDGLRQGQVVYVSVFGSSARIITGQIDRMLSRRGEPDVCLIAVSRDALQNMAGLNDDHQMPLEIVRNPVPEMPIGHAASLQSSDKNNSIPRVKLVNVRRTERRANDSVLWISSHLIAITDIATTGHSGASIFTPDFSAVFGILLQDNDVFNFVNQLETYASDLWESRQQVIRSHINHRIFRRTVGGYGEENFAYKPLEYFVQRGTLEDLQASNGEQIGQVRLMDPISKFTILMHSHHSVGWSVEQLDSVEDENGRSLLDVIRRTELRRRRYQVMLEKHPPISYWQKKGRNKMYFMMTPTYLFDANVQEPKLAAINCSERPIRIRKTANLSDVEHRPCGTGSTITPCSPTLYYVYNDFGQLELWRTDGEVIFAGDKVIGAETIMGYDQTCQSAVLPLRQYLRHDPEFST